MTSNEVTVDPNRLKHDKSIFHRRELVWCPLRLFRFSAVSVVLRLVDCTEKGASVRLNNPINYPMTLDLTGITTKAALHQLFKRELHFPDWYGVSWDAFWDSIIAIVEMPDHLTLTNWQEFAQACPRDMQILRQVIQDYAETMAPKRIVLA